MAAQLDHRGWTAALRTLRHLPHARHPALAPRQTLSLDLRPGVNEHQDHEGKAG
jgi:hypothetical protein